MMTNRIILGTANFKKSYNGSIASETSKILEYAEKVGVWAIDTATEYGTHNLHFPKRIVKVDADDVLFGDPPDVIMAHGINGYERAISLSNEKQCFLGASIYIDDIELLNGYAVRPDCIQIPYSLMDRRFEDYLKSIKGAGIQVQARSVFLRGKILKKVAPFDALMFVLANQYVDKVVIGTESLQMLQDTLEPLIDMDAMKSTKKKEIDPRYWE
jgi:aryl-alcohol dehydrogenase-like predicted oxidoreductase